MALQTIVKISNVTNLSDARYCAGMGVDLLGFSMDENSEQYVAPEKFKEIRSWVAGVHTVGETASIDVVEIERLLELYQPEVLQIEESALLPYISTFDCRVILKADLSLMTLDQLEALFSSVQSDQIDYYLLESKGAINLDEDLKTVLKNLAGEYPVLLGIGFTTDTIHELLAELPIQGIALTGGDEDRPGSREFGELMEMLETLETDD
ncbi:N-(5'-phosphoribosyl)anthranilate isomerase [Larkinella terrae]|uniref:N-(5'-phosphoribosyl)anthranilate isomerase n=1 Tax=Larkinella terrae TaxID=2025311 RepID=A0A7K0EJX3_9BACT|nr:N-(5'-phosphoribosyl)anthranilate isomerase [Larkinella terrae]MRS62084.1 N-(5'-phosphoribosyl)anthranilate isomerase [Larkinella terrae]